MKSTLLLVSAFAAAALATSLARAEEVVTIYSADGLHDGTPSWYGNEFDAFTKATGIKVQYVEAGSGGVVERVAKEASADQIAAEQKDPAGSYEALVNNYMNFIYNASVLSDAPKAFDDLLDKKFKGKIQYSTPGQAGDGTAVMIEVIHAFGGKDAGFTFFKKLQDNNVGPSSSTGKLTALVNKGELYVANGDLQMNMAQMADNPNIKIFWPAGPDGKRSTFALPYYVGLVKGAPHADNGKKLIDFLLSKDAQSTITSVALGMPVRMDVKPTDKSGMMLTDAMKGIEIWTPDWAAVLKDLQTDAGRWHEATGS